MSESIVHDLDVLRPKPEYVKLGGKKIDVSFIPSGIAIDAMILQQELTDLAGTPEALEELQRGGEAAKRSFEITARLCARITESQHPEMTEEWLMKNTNVMQMKALMDLVVKAVFRSLESVEDDEIKKPQAVEESP